jgi:heme iron utilization protein
MENQPSSEDRVRLARMLRETRWSALATSRDDEPFSSWVAVAAEPDFAGFLLHLSRLALHTRYLEANPRASLSISESDVGGTDDPQQLARASVQGRVVVIARDSAEYAEARRRYLDRFPAAATHFEFADFSLFRLVPESVRFVPGFGHVYRMGIHDLRALAKQTV